jgi:amino acid adenylation domain-containing protein
MAATDLERRVSYAELIDEAARLGGGLRDRGVVEGDRVALLIPNSVDFVVGALAALWVGAIFVPLAVTDPPSRLEAVVADSAPALIIKSSSADTEYPSLGDAPTVSVEDLRGNIDSTPSAETRPRGAYIIYTSGTTGTPKGVLVGSVAFAAAVESTATALGIGPTTKTLCVSPFHFDGSYANLFPTLISGGTVVIRPREALLFPRTFFRAIEEEEITYSGFTPSYLRLLLASRQVADLKDSSLQVVAFGGEALTAADLGALWAHAPTLRVFNRYGPTEATIAVTNAELTPDMIEGGVVPIGRPHNGVTFALFDADDQVIASANRTGELYIGGIQLMEGYWKDRTLTRSVMHEIGQIGIMYRTGDLVYRDERDNYVYVERADSVIKRNGVRISLIELSDQMRTIDGIVSAACVAYDYDGALGIVAFVTTARELSDVDIRRAARTLIPDTMLPDRIERIDAMPLNRSNQLDEAQLLLTASLRPYRQA